MSSRTLSKSDFTLARTCDAKLFFRENRYPDRREGDAYLNMLAEGGYMVEALAKTKFPDGIQLDYGQNTAANLVTTLAYLQQENVTLFAATLLVGRRLARVDILEKRGNVIRLLEVKAKSFDGAEHAASLAEGKAGALRGVKKPHPIRAEWESKLDDITFQVLLLEQLCPGVTIKPYLVLVDTSKRAGIDGVPDLFELVHRTSNDGTKHLDTAHYIGSAEQLEDLDLVTEVDVSVEVAMLRDDVQAASERFEALLDEPFSTYSAGLQLGAKCTKCEFRLDEANDPHGFAECWGALAAPRPHMLELLGHPTEKFGIATPEATAYMRAALTAGHSIRDRELSIVTRGGEIRQVILGAELLELRGEPHVVTTFVDITDRKREEEARRVANARYRALFDYAPDGIVIADGNGRYLDANASVCRMLGYPSDELFSIGLAKAPDRSSLIEWMLARGTTSLLDIPNEGLTKNDGTVSVTAERQRRQIEYTRRREVFVSPLLREKIDALHAPMHFIDFETSRLALPYHRGMRPYGLVTFQWSCHTVTSPAAPPVHREWLNDTDVWPNLKFAQSLREAIGDEGPVLTWSHFEEATLKEIIRNLQTFGHHEPTLVGWMTDVFTRRIVDLHEWARKDYYHPGMRGRTSIKVVLDALWKSDERMRAQFESLTGFKADPTQDPYASLPAIEINGVMQDVHEGTGAMRAYQEMMYGAYKNDPLSKGRWGALLKQYCALDTLSMVLILDHWRRCVNDNRLVGAVIPQERAQRSE